MTLSLFDDHQPLQLLNHQGVVTAWYDFFDANKAQQLFNELLDNSHWLQETVQIYAKTFAQPRLTCWYGPYGLSAASRYQQLQSSQDYTPLLLELKQQIEQRTGHRFNCVLANLYRDGNDAVGYHADDEKALGINPAIASFSLGATRRFLIKHNQHKNLRQGFDLQHNCLLLMEGSLQQFYQHAIGKTKKTVGPRINLTFRTINPNL